MSKIKLVPRPEMQGKDGKKIFMLAVMEGRRFTTYDDIVYIKTHDLIIHWDSNFGQCPVREGQDRWRFRGFSKLHELVEQQWYEDPDMVGKPVKVRDSGKDSWEVYYFSRYNGTNHMPYYAGGTNWKYAEPLTAADLYQEQV